MKRRIVCCIMPALLAVLLPACGNPTYPDFEPQDVVYRLTVIQQDHGLVLAKPGEGITGTRVNIAINPDPGYIIKAGSILLGDLIPNGQNYKMADRPPFEYLIASRNVNVKAEFTPVPAGNFTVHIAPLEHGMIQAVPQYGPPGAVVQLIITPDSGYALKEGSLKSNGAVVTTDRYEIRIPANQHAVVSAEFEKTSAAAYITNGKRAIRNDNFNTAMDLFESAYRQSPENNEAILYSSFGKLLSHLVSPRVRPLLARTGFAVPSSVNYIFVTSTNSTASGEWLQWYDDRLLPKSDRPSGFTSGFNNFPLQFPAYYKDAEGNDNLRLVQLYTIMNILAINANTDQEGMNKKGDPNGCNKYLDDLLKYVFGDDFEEICRRAESLDPNYRLAMDSGIMEKCKGFLEIFGLHEAYTGADVYLGRAELEAALSWLRLVKASVEFLSAYDWNIDTSFIKVRYMSMEPEDLETINGILNQYFFQVEFGLEAKFKTLGFVDAALLTRMLPFRNKLLTERNSGMLSKARADYVKALTTLNESYAYYYRPDAQVASQSKDLLDTKYTWLRDGVDSLLQAVSSGGNFIVPESFPNGGSWADATAGAKYTVNMTKLFTPGQFTLAKLVSSEQNGKAATFFGFNADGSGGTVITRQNQIPQYGGIGLEINMTPIKEVFVTGFESYGNGAEWLHTLLPGALLTPENGGKLYEYYQTW